MKKFTLIAAASAMLIVLSACAGVRQPGGEDPETVAGYTVHYMIKKIIYKGRVKLCQR